MSFPSALHRVYLQGGVAVAPGKTEKRLKPQQPKFCVCSDFWHIYRRSGTQGFVPVMPLLKDAAIIHCSLSKSWLCCGRAQLQLTARQVRAMCTWSLMARSSKASRAVGQLVPKDALWHRIGLSPAPIVPAWFCFTHLAAAGLGFWWKYECPFLSNRCRFDLQVWQSRHNLLQM